MKKSKPDGGMSLKRHQMRDETVRSIETGSLHSLDEILRLRYLTTYLTSSV